MSEPSPADKITVLLLDLGRELRGGQLQVYYLARALLRSADFVPLVACPKNSALAKMLDKEKIPCLRLLGHSQINPAVLLKTAWALHKHSVKIIHTHDAHAASLGAFFKRFNKARLLIHSRRVSYPLHSGMRSKKYVLADAVVGVSQEISLGMQNAGLDPQKVHTIHSGIDPSRYRVREERHDGRIVFLSIGAFTPQKGYSILLQAMSLLRDMEDLPPWEVRIVGDGPLFQEIFDQAVALHVEQYLALLGRQDSRMILPLCDILLVPSVDGEGSSATIKEGWVCGLPVICSALPSNTELVRDKLDGLTSAVGNPLALAATMTRCMQDEALRTRLAKAGLQRVQEFTDQRMAESYMDLYRQLLKKQKTEYPEKKQQVKTDSLQETEKDHSVAKNLKQTKTDHSSAKKQKV